MAKPVILTITPFDAAIGTAVKFTYSGDQVYGHDIEIINNESGETVYAETVTSMKLLHTIPADCGLVNGLYYACRVRMFNGSGSYSSWSDYLPFYCYSTPVFGFENFANGQTVENSEFTVTIAYQQAEGEALNTFYVLLYDSNKNMIADSGTKLANDEEACSFNGLENGRQYYIRAFGETVDHMTVDTGFYMFNVAYIVPAMWNYVDLINNTHDGNVRVSCNIKIVTGQADGEVRYIDDLRADLTDGTKVWFEEGYFIADQYSILMQGKHFGNNEIVLYADNGSGQMTIRYYETVFDSYREDGGKCAYFQLESRQGPLTYVILSNRIARPEDKMVRVIVHKRENSYSIECETVESEVS